jgi:hypothetical protein
MKNMPIKQKRSPRLIATAPGLILVGGLIASGLTAAWTLLGGSLSDAEEARDLPRLEWLVTDNGERRGVALLSDLSRDGQAWQLWGCKSGMASLNTIKDLLPKKARRLGGLGLNGGYWDEFKQPVGVCAGERGVYSARSHPGGFAIAAGRAWIGPLAATAGLAALDGNGVSTNSIEIQFNPRPPARRNPCLIDPRTYPVSPLVMEADSRVVWLDREGPLRFNVPAILRVRRSAVVARVAAVQIQSEESLLWITPERKDRRPELPQVGRRYELRLTLSPPQGEVRLATCAGPRLLKGGKVVMGPAAETGKWDEKERTWRTAVGCDATGQRLWCVLLARGKDGKPGVTLEETGRSLLELGATEGLNLDGGSSTSVWCAEDVRSGLRELFPLQTPIHHALYLAKRVVASPLSLGRAPEDD